MPMLLTYPMIKEAAREYNLEPAALRAIIAVESGGSGFLPDGRLKILYERHAMWQRLKSRDIDPNLLAKAHPLLCGSRWDPKRHPYGSQAGQYDKLLTIITWAQQHHTERWESYKKAAYEACSWGLFQVMGYHYAACGYSDIYTLKHTFEESEEHHLRAILRWMSGNGLITHLRAKNWERFARGYNGAGQVGHYANKLRQAYMAAHA